MAASADSAVVRLDVETESGSRQGSGFFVSRDGRLLTNYHVVRNATGIEVRLSSGDVYERTSVFAVDRRRDLAVLQVPAFGVAALRLGDSEPVRVGTGVVAVGTPHGLDNTVSTGIVSGRRPQPEGYELLQVSAPASQGSSGGPILTRDGEVIGIAVTQMEEGENLNFAVPVDYARALLARADTAGPVAVSRSARGADRNAAAADPETPGDRSGARAANRGLRFATEDFEGDTVASEGPVGDGRRERRRVAYRRIDPVGEAPPRIERYAEREIVGRRGPDGKRRTVRRERSRQLVRADGLQPVSARGEVAWRSEGEWRRTSYRLEFDGSRVTGFVRDAAGRRREIDRDLRAGVLLRGTADLAFALVEADSLVGRSVGFVSLDGSSGELVRVRYDVRGVDTITVAGRSRPALRVDVASGLERRRAYFRADRPRLMLRRTAGDAGSVGASGWPGRRIPR